MFLTQFVCTSVCSFLFLSVNRITENVLAPFSWNLVKGCRLALGRNHYILERIRTTVRIHKLFLTFINIVRYGICVTFIWFRNNQKHLFQTGKTLTTLALWNRAWLGGGLHSQSCPSSFLCYPILNVGHLCTQFIQLIHLNKPKSLKICFTLYFYPLFCYMSMFS